jgi:hypothetical protein
VVGEAGEQHHRDRLRGEDEERGNEQGADVDGRGKGSGPQALEDAALAPDDEEDRDSGERRRCGAVAEEAGEQDPPGGLPVDLAGVEGAHEDVEQNREQEREERGLAASPVQELLRFELVEEQPHSSTACCSVSER